MTDGRDIRKAAYSDPYSTIERYQKGDVTILTFSGKYTQKLKHNATEMVKSLRGDVALLIKDISPVDMSLASFLRALQQQVQEKKHSFILLKPPARIVDMLNMCYGPEEFTIVQNETQMIKQASLKKRNFVGTQAKNPPMDETMRKVATLRREVIKTEEREKSLEIARTRLIKMLPQVPPRIPHLEIGFLYKPSDKVGGDVFDVIDLQQGRHGIFMGDVSGHGIEAAVVVGMAKKVFDIYSKILITPRRVLAQSNREIYPELDSNTFITAIYGVIEEATMTFTYGRAGHPHPILYNEITKAKPQVLTSKGMSLGLDSGKLFDKMIKEEVLQFHRGDILIMYTDGITEAANEEGVEFGIPRLLDTIVRAPSKEPTKLVAHIYQTAMSFAQVMEQQDDITLICIKAP